MFIEKLETMILIADSGSTKVDWRIITADKKVYEASTAGINPFYQNVEEIYTEIEHSLAPQIKAPIQQIYFYGAGCTTSDKTAILTKAFHKSFPKADTEVDSDLLAAARALCGKDAGIACILGTGMNTCYYDGEKIADHVPPLGYMLGDEGSGAYLGRKLVVAYLRKSLPNDMVSAFYDEYKTEKAEILDSVYKQSFPNRYLAKFTRFLKKYSENNFIKELVLGGFDDFFENTILCYPQSHEYPVNFVGSIAYHFSDLLGESAAKHSLRIGKILQTPIKGLVEYHKQLIDK